MTKAEYFTYVDNLAPDNVVGAIGAVDFRAIFKSLGGQLYDDYATLADLGAQGPRQLWLKPSNGQPATTNSEDIYHNGSVGIGIAPTQKLQVQGNAIISGNLSLPGSTALLTVGTSTAMAVMHVARSGGVNSMLSELGQGTDNKHWMRTISGLTLTESVVNDANNSTAAWLVVTRSAVTIASTFFRVGGVDLVKILPAGMGIGTSGSPTSMLHLKGATGYTQLRLETTYTPTGTADTNGAIGDTAWDGSYWYIKTAAGWKRAALATF